MSAAEILITGTRSGLGRYLHERFGGLEWRRTTGAEQQEQFRRSNLQAIIHCAFNSRPPKTDRDLFGYVSDNILLTLDAARVPAHKFIFVSSVDVYPKDHAPALEDSDIELDEVQGVYGLSKLMAESIVRHHCPNHLILRCSMLLGRYSRRNSLFRIVEENQCTLTLSADSSFNYIRHQDVGDFISMALESDVRGTYNLAATGNVTLRELADRLGRQVRFGSFRYDAGQVNNDRAARLLPALRRSSAEVAEQFIKENWAAGTPGTSE